MTPKHFVQSVQRQFDAALLMLAECIDKCPDEHWDKPVGTLPFWEVVYHALGWKDLYLAKSKESWQPETSRKPAARSAGDGLPRLPLHPMGLKELWEQHPSRKFEREELQRYAKLCRVKLKAALAAETPKSLAGPSGFRWIKGPRAEAYLYNLRHLAGHTGQLTAFLWRLGVETKWVRGGRA